MEWRKGVGVSGGRTATHAAEQAGDSLRANQMPREASSVIPTILDVERENRHWTKLETCRSTIHKRVLAQKGRRGFAGGLARGLERRR